MHLMIILKDLRTWSGLYFALLTGFLSNVDSQLSRRWLVGSLRRLWGEEPSGKMGEIKLFHSFWNLSSLWQEP